MIEGELKIVKETFLGDGSIIVTFENVPQYIFDHFAKIGLNLAKERFANWLDEKKDYESSISSVFEFPTDNECFSIGINHAMLKLAQELTTDKSCV